MDADDRGGWTQIFGGKASEPKTSRPVEKCNFSYPHLIWHPRWELGVIQTEFPKTLVRRCLRDPTFSRFCITLTCDGRTTDRQAMTANTTLA